MYWTRIFGILVQVFGRDPLDVWALEVGREVGPGRGRPRKSN